MDGTRHLSLPEVLRIQAGYYALTGVWPIIHIASFEAITGPKLERWLVRTLGGTVAAIGASLWTAARGPNPLASRRQFWPSAALPLSVPPTQSTL